MNDEIKEMTKVLKSLGNKQASELYNYITNLPHSLTPDYITMVLFFLRTERPKTL